MTPKKSWRKRDSNPGSSALESDALHLGQQTDRQTDRDTERYRGGGGRERGRTETEEQAVTTKQTDRQTEFLNTK